jgi:hypothetical protein
MSGGVGRAMAGEEKEYAEGEVPGCMGSSSIAETCWKSKTWKEAKMREISAFMIACILSKQLRNNSKGKSSKTIGTKVCTRHAKVECQKQNTNCFPETVNRNWGRKEERRASFRKQSSIVRLMRHGASRQHVFQVSKLAPMYSQTFRVY